MFTKYCVPTSNCSTSRLSIAAISVYFDTKTVVFLLSRFRSTSPLPAASQIPASAAPNSSGAIEDPSGYMLSVDTPLCSSPFTVPHIRSPTKNIMSTLADQFTSLHSGLLLHLTAYFGSFLRTTTFPPARRPLSPSLADGEAVGPT